MVLTAGVALADVVLGVVLELTLLLEVLGRHEVSPLPPT